MVKLSGTTLNTAKLRRTILDLAYYGKAGHLGSSLSLVEILAVLYGRFIRWNPDDVSDPDRDILALSKGHGVMAVYASLYQMGLLNDRQIRAYNGPENHLKGLSSAMVPGIDVSGGSLGHGFPTAVGMALGMRLHNKTNRVFCIAGDGEMNEGSMWEALMFAAHHKLSNLVLIVDANGYQAMGPTADILNLNKLANRISAFDIETYEVDGHDAAALDETFRKAVNSPSPSAKAVVAYTVKGKGISFIENSTMWHYQRLTDDLYEKACKEISQ